MTTEHELTLEQFQAVQQELKKGNAGRLTAEVIDKVKTHVQQEHGLNINEPEITLELTDMPSDRGLRYTDQMSTHYYHFLQLQPEKSLQWLNTELRTPRPE